MALLNDSERHVVDLLADAWNAFCALEEIHFAHQQEFYQAIHIAQRTVMARPVAREFKAEMSEQRKGNPE